MSTTPEVVDRETWLTARRALMEEEKALTRQRDAVSRRRRELPWVEVDQEYLFDTEAGPKSLPELFEGRRQLAVYHFMYGPDWDEGCPSCSFWADSYDGIGIHLAHRDTTLIAVSRAPLNALIAYRDRMGWSFPWVSSLGNTFNMDYAVSFPEGHRDDASYNYAPLPEPPEELPGLSIFTMADDGTVYHSYSCYSRGLDPFNSAYQILDLTPLGRHEDDLEWSMAWLRRHDQYED